jgi:hypothetical protein
MEPNPQSKKELLVDYPAYYVESVAADNVGRDETTLVAIDVQVREHYVRWFDTVKERRLGDGNVEKAEDGSLGFTDHDSGFMYRLIPLSLEVYNQHVRPHLYNSQTFNNAEDMWESLLATQQDAS